MIGDGHTLRIVRAEPDEEPVTFSQPRSVYASWGWITKEFMKELEEQ